MMIDTDVADLGPAAMLAELRARAELDLLAAVLACPARGVAVAASLGVAGWMFGQDDLRAIWCAAEVNGWGGQMAVVRLARWALEREGFWDDSQIAGNLGSMRWSAESLAALVCSAFWSVPLLVQRAEHLLGFIRAEQLAGELIRRSERVIQSAITRPFLRRREP